MILAKQPSKSHSMRAINPRVRPAIKQAIFLEVSRLMYLYIQAV